MTQRLYFRLATVFSVLHVVSHVVWHIDNQYKLLMTTISRDEGRHRQVDAKQTLIGVMIRRRSLVDFGVLVR